MNPLVAGSGLVAAPASMKQNDAGRHVSVREERRHARVGVVRTWLKPSPIGFLNHPTRHLFFTGKGGVGKTSLSTAAALTLVDPIGFAELSKLVNKPSAATATR